MAFQRSAMGTCHTDPPCFGTVLMLIAVGLFHSVSANAQSGSKPVFDVASVRVAKLGDIQEDREDIRTSPGTLVMRHVSLKSCIQWAYGLNAFQLSGADWLASDRFDITAKVNAPAQEDQLRLMLQSLLTERFKLAFRRTERQEQIYILTVSRSGPKFREAKGEGSSRMTPGKFGFTAERASIQQLAEYLSIPMRKPVLDRTGLTGRYDFAVDLTPYATGSSQAPDLSELVLTAVQDQLGLNLESHKGPVAFLVVEHAERTPTQN